MANLDQKAGFRPVNSRDVNSYTGKSMRVAFLESDATAAFVGSLVRFTGASADDGRTPVVTLSAPGDSAAQLGQLAGAIMRFEYNPANLEQLFKPASQFRYAWIPTDRNTLYFVQVGNGTLTTAAVNQNINFTTEAGSTITGNSTQEIDAATVDTAATLPLRIVRAEFADDNEPTTAQGKWIVALNLDSYSNTTGV